MKHGTKIEWAIAVAEARGMRADVWGPVEGCSPVGEGCRFCWAAKEVWIRSHNSKMKRFHGLVDKTADGRAVFNGKINFVADDLEKPLRRRRPTVWFSPPRSDLFHVDLLIGHQLEILEVMRARPDHLFLVLTKRPLNAFVDLERFPGWPLPNVWLGVSVWDQASADRMIPKLLETEAALRWVSYEPALGPVDLRPYLAGLDWIVFGDESGSDRDVYQDDWGRSVRDQAGAAGVPVFNKQRHDERGRKVSLPALDGEILAEVPLCGT